ncbi:MAG TPA: amidase family protein [Methylomirabilota bacterium]|jgi:aspartyl-tRNA(Asn)/glutamyl-tRNA(Gln) amidotransferase subunit A|nr:amidase family protein [Methylomirabilota bacterium]
MATAGEICRMDAVTVAARVRARRLSPVEVIDAVLDRLERVDPVLHAFCTPAPEAARQDARAQEARLTKGEEVGPLAGVPVSIKDLILTRGLRTTSGSLAYRDFVPEEDDVVVERLRAAGAIVIGKTNTSEFGYSATGHNPLFETTRNPWNTALTPGGSSAGAGVAVATGVGPIAIGSDGGGSVRIPAAHCGVYGFKPSMGRIPLYPGSRDERYPGVSGWESLENIGPLSRTVADSALVLSVTAGPDPRDRHSLPAGDTDWRRCLEGDVRGLRVAYSPDWGYAAVDPAVRRIATAAARVFERDLGCHVEEASPGWEDPGAAFAALIVAETDLRGMRELASRYEGQMSPHMVDLLRRPWTAEDLTSANVTRKAIANRMWRLMARYDLLLTPTLTVPPFALHMQGPEKVDGRYVRPEQWLSFTYPINMTGQPAASVPAGWTDDGLPVGLQIVGRHLDDALVLRASAAFEAAAPWRDRWPSLLATLGL